MLRLIGNVAEIYLSRLIVVTDLAVFEQFMLAKQMMHVQEVIPGALRIRDTFNLATWMVEVSSIAAERQLGIDFAEHNKSVALHQDSSTCLSVITGAMFAGVVFAGINNRLTVQPGGVVAKRTVHYEERTAGMYTPQYFKPHHIISHQTSKYNNIGKMPSFRSSTFFTGLFVPKLKTPKCPVE
ncbi:hypothetical protein POM88_036433 [Heracleum sosnowskyi]|uniref:Uncharacterized protein n=1 Tax=Heracleum sosnowskyi TaxID=360622 RepID=A0AAD8HND8_9APIA|nr:hypothetical protein POM88_036433 [Heracleum sosnowskyi]